MRGGLRRLSLAAGLLLLPACGADVHSFGFLAAKTRDFAPAATAAAVADFDGDGRADLAVAGPDDVGLLPGLPSGGFGDRRSLQPIARVIALAAADFDGDSRPDLAALSGDTPPQVRVLRNIAGAPGAPGAARPVDLGSYALGAGHLNGDPLADLVVATSSLAVLVDPGVRLLLATQGGWSDPEPGRYPVDLPGKALRQAIALADLNLDAARSSDLVFIKGASASEVKALNGGGNGTFGASFINVRDGLTASALAAADVNGDGAADVLVAQGDQVRVILARGDGTFRAPLDYGVGLTPGWIAAADVDGDGRLDLIAISDQKVAVRQNASQ